MTPYPRLFAPLRLGNLTLRNRVVFSAHLTNYAENGLRRSSTRATTRRGPAAVRV